MKNKHFILLTLLVSVFGIVSGASADQRFYVWTYQYQTMERGKAEAENYFTLSTPDIGHIEGTMSAEHQIELEVGMTERFDFSIYQVFKQNPGEELNYEGFKLRSRYKIGESSRYIFDPLIYLEYKGKPDFSEHGIEFKLILARDMERVNISLNPIFEFEHEGKWEFEPEYAVGASYEISRTLRIGLEAKGGEHGHYIGPTVSHGREDLWAALGCAFKIAKIEEGKPEFQIRMLMGVGF